MIAQASVLPRRPVTPTAVGNYVPIPSSEWVPVKRFRFRLGATVYNHGMEAVVVDRQTTPNGQQIFGIVITDGNDHGRPLRYMRKEFLTRDPPAQ